MFYQDMSRLKQLEKRVSKIDKQQNTKKYSRVYQQYKQEFKRVHGEFPGEEIVQFPTL